MKHPVMGQSNPESMHRSNRYEGFNRSIDRSIDTDRPTDREGRAPIGVGNPSRGVPSSAAHARTNEWPTTTFEVSEADAAARRAAGGDAARCVVCMEDIAVGDVLRRMAKCPHACHAPCLERWLATTPKCPVCGTV